MTLDRLEAEAAIARGEFDEAVKRRAPHVPTVAFHEDPTQPEPARRLARALDLARSVAFVASLSLLAGVLLSVQFQRSMPYDDLAAAMFALAGLQALCHFIYRRVERTHRLPTPEGAA